MLGCGFLVAVAAYLLSQAYRIAEANVVAPFEYVHLPFAVLWGFLFWGDLPDGVAVLGIALLGAGFGAWLSSMIGVNVPNRQLKQFEDAVDQGEFLFLADVPKARVEEIEEMVKKHHPEAEIEGTEPTIPAFP